MKIAQTTNLHSNEYLIQDMLELEKKLYEMSKKNSFNIIYSNILLFYT